MLRWAPCDWPFLEPRHAGIGERIDRWGVAAHLLSSGGDLAVEAKRLVSSLGEAGLLELVIPSQAADGPVPFDVRALCMAREGLAYHHVLSDTMFAMQGLGTAPIALVGTAEQRRRYLGPARAGLRIAGLAISEPEAGSDVAGISTTARDEGEHYVLDGTKTWITNAGIADHYVVLARTGEAPGARGLSTFVVDADTPGLTAEPFDLIAPHPIGNLTFENCRIPKANLIGERGQGFKIAMTTFDFFRPTVGAAAVGIARRALSESLQRVMERRMFGKAMTEIESVQTKIAEMTVDVETAALAVYRAAWQKDVKGGRSTKEASAAKLIATEAAQRVVDAAVQLFGGMGLVEGGIIGQLYREVRPMRIYEGASEVQKLVIARNVLAEARAVMAGEA